MSEKCWRKRISLYIVQTFQPTESIQEFELRAKDIKKRANKFNFPNLLLEVNKGLEEPLHFEREFQSLQRVRNCLEHRAGFVGEDDVEDGTDTLVLTLPRFMIFAEIDGSEVEALPGTTFEKPALLKVRRTIRERAYKLGDRVQFDFDSLNEAAFGCHVLGTDLITKLPKSAT